MLMAGDGGIGSCSKKQDKKEAKTLAKQTLPLVPLTEKDMSHVSGGRGNRAL